MPEPQARASSVHSNILNTPAASKLPDAVMIFSWPLSKEIMAEVKLTGSGIRSVHLERLRQYLELAKDAVDSDDGDGGK
jgi:hypothetical protein